MEPNDQAAYEKAYRTKKEEDGVYAMNEFCSEVDGKLGVESIPALLHLYEDEAITCEQNEFVTEVIGSIFEKFPESCTKAVVDNILILQEEDAEWCLFHILLVFVYWHPENRTCFIEALKNAEEEKRNYLIALLKDLCAAEKDKDGVLQDILERVNA